MIEPVRKPIPTADPSAVGRTVGVVYRDAPTIYVFESVMAELADYAKQDMGCELGGFLVGGLHKEQAPYIEIRGFLPATDTKRGVVSITFTHQTWATMTRQVEERFPDEIILGWMHTHPGLGVFLSSYDLFIHRHFFSQPWQIAVVVDPRKNQLGFFQWRRNRVVNCGFICVRRGTR